MGKTVLIRNLMKNKTTKQFSITLPKKDIDGLGKNCNPLEEPKRIKIKIKGLLW